MSAHTPGPWPLITVPTSIGSCHRIGQFPSCSDGDFIAACVYADGIRPGIDDLLPRAQTLLANAQLIAAAPDLLVVAKQIRAHGTISSTWIDALDAAIAKATGVTT